MLGTRQEHVVFPALLATPVWRLTAERWGWRRAAGSILMKTSAGSFSVEARRTSWPAWCKTSTLKGEVENLPLVRWFPFGQTFCRRESQNRTMLGLHLSKSKVLMPMLRWISVIRCFRWMTSEMLELDGIELGFCWACFNHSLGFPAAVTSDPDGDYLAFTLPAQSESLRHSMRKGMHWPAAREVGYLEGLVVQNEASSVVCSWCSDQHPWGCSCQTAFKLPDACWDVVQHVEDQVEMLLSLFLTSFLPKKMRGWADEKILTCLRPKVADHC